MPFAFNRSTDYRLLNRLVKSKRLYPFLGDDFAPAIDDAAVVEHEAVWYVLGYKDGEILGFWMFHPDNGNSVCWQMHTVMPLNAACIAATRELLGADGWLWRNTPCLRVVTNVPGCSRIALRAGLRMGFVEYGRNPESFLKYGKLQDQILMGISKPSSAASLP